MLGRAPADLGRLATSVGQVGASRRRFSGGTNRRLPSSTALPHGEANLLAAQIRVEELVVEHRGRLGREEDRRLLEHLVVCLRRRAGPWS